MKKNEAIQSFKNVLDVYLSNLHGAPDTEALAVLLLNNALEIGMDPPPHQERFSSGYEDAYGMEETQDMWVQGWELE